MSDVITANAYSEKRRTYLTGRVVVWFSCGAASAVAAKIAVDTYGRANTVVAYCDTLAYEHPDNRRFLADVERWIDHPITLLKSSRYRDVWDVWERTRYLVGIHGARCTDELKKAVRQQFEDPMGDRQVFGYTCEEGGRISRFREENREVYLEAPLFDRGISKADCLRAIAAAGIAVPAMYRLGYNNNNCIGCVKGGQGYWNKIRVDFPDVFARMAAMERTLNVAINKTYAGDGKRKRLFLDELPPDAGRDVEPAMDCGLLCGLPDEAEEVTHE